MKKVTMYIYGFIWIFITPCIIGGAVGDSAATIYHRHNETLLAGIAICVSIGLIVAWIPMAFTAIFEKAPPLPFYIPITWFSGSVVPIIFGFDKIGSPITVLLVFVSAMTVSQIHQTVSKNSRREEKG